MSKSISDEDKALFRDAMKTVTPLKSVNKRLISSPIRVTAPVRKKENTDKLKFKSTYLPFYLSSNYSTEIQSETVLSYHRQNFPTKRFRELKLGTIPYETKLDLHGLKPDKAQEILAHFINKAIEKNSRSVLIIHGKGSLRNEPPVLKNLVNYWLPQFPEVSAFHSALPKDGGNGAVYVFLKLKRTDT